TGAGGGCKMLPSGRIAEIGRSYGRSGSKRKLCNGYRKGNCVGRTLIRSRSANSVSNWSHV
ncbi:hypothetical protein PIB30_115711, partial [Stylosanthes scabra]|nr:hypothetical protein [Stylosanthes scabra]